MRPAWIAVGLAALGPTGCSGLVAGSGKNLEDIRTRDEAHAAFAHQLSSSYGDPDPAGACRHVSDTFRTRRKIAERDKLMSIAMLDGPTLGLAEFYLFPRELFIAGRRSVLGQTIEVEYDPAGRVVGIKRDGVYAFGCWPKRHKSDPPVGGP